MNLKEIFSGFDTSNEKSYRKLTGIILLVAAVLRLSNLDFSYSNDELSALFRVQYHTFSDLVDKGFFVDGHPGGIQVFLYYWVKLFGMKEWIVRLPFALAGVLAVYFAIKVFSRWFGSSTGLLTGAFLAFLEFPLLYSQIARPYGSGLLFSMMMAWYWTRLLFDEKPKASMAIAFSFSAAACMYNHYFSFLLALIIGITGVFYLKRDRILHYLGAGLAAALIFSPHIYITLNHLSIGGVGLWLAKPDKLWLAGHIWYLFDQSVIIALIVSFIVISSLFFARKSLSLNRFHLFSLIFFFVPFLIGFFYSRLENPVLQHSVLIFSFPFLIALLFSFAGKIPSKWAGFIVMVVLFAGTTQTILGNRYYKKQHFGEFRGIAQTIDQWNRKFGENNITRAISVNNPWYINFYLDQCEGGRTTFAQHDNRGGDQLDSLARILDTCQTKYFLYAWTKPIPIEINDIIKARYPCIAQFVSYEGLAEATLYSKTSEQCVDAGTDTLFRIIGESGKPEISAILIMDSLEFSPGYDGSAASLMQGKSGHLVATAEIMAENTENGALLAASFHDTDGETIQWMGARANLYCKPGQWSIIRQTIPIPDQKLLQSRLKVYLWNPAKSKLRIRNFTIIAEPLIKNNLKSE